MATDTVVDTQIQENLDRRLTRPRGLRRAAALGVVASALVLVMSSQSGVVAQSGGAIISGWNASPPGLDPHVEGALTASRAVSLIYDPLVELDPDGNLVPALAESWEEDGNDVVFKLRQGVTFHDGSAFDADDVLATMARIQDPDTASWKAAFTGTITDVVAEDSHTVRFVQDAYNAALLPFLFRLEMIPKELAEDPNAADIMKTTAIGTGAFKLDSWDPLVSMELSKNENYWKDGKPFVDTVTLLFLPDEATALAAIRSGQINHLTLTDVRNAATVEGDANLSIVQTVGAGSIMNQINFRKPEMADLKVRQALSAAFDRQAVLDATAAGLGSVSGPITPFLAAYHVPPAELPFHGANIEEAKALLAESGFPDGFDLIIITSSEFGVMQGTAELMAAQYRELGINTEIKSTDVTTWINNKNKPPFDWHIANNLDAAHFDPDGLYGTFVTGQGPAVQGEFSFPELDALLEAGRAESDPAKRAEIYRDAQIMIADQAPIIFSFAPIFVDILGEGVSGFEGLPHQLLRGFDSVTVP